MCLEVPLKDLPLAFQHAVGITKRLGINYLWIDSLCILQSGKGSSEDWRKHLTEMRLVYSNCLSASQLHMHQIQAQDALPLIGCVPKSRKS